MTHLRRLPLSVLTAALRCSSDSIDPGNEPASVTEVSGNGQVGLVNQTLAAPLVVQVEDGAGNPIEGVTVRWRVGGGGSVNQSQVVTGPDGQA